MAIRRSAGHEQLPALAVVLVDAHAGVERNADEAFAKTLTHHRLEFVPWNAT